MSLAIKAGRRTVEISRPEKPLFGDGITKGDLAHYYQRIAEVMLPHIADRPLNLERYPDGIDGQKIFQQHASKHFPDWIKRVEVPARGHSVEHVVANDAATLVYLANQASITPHAWLSRRDRLNQPDRLIFDLDPHDASKPDEVRKAAQAIGELLREIGLVPWAMTTGSRGYHVTVPLRRGPDHDAVRAFAREFAQRAVQEDPDTFTIEQRKAKREGRILIDIQRNAYAHTAVAPYAVRARPGAPVATPLHWDELADSNTHPTRWTLNDVSDRVKELGADPWREIAKSAQGLSAARKRLSASPS